MVIGQPIGTPIGGGVSLYARRLSPTISDELSLGAIVRHERDHTDGSVIQLLEPAWIAIAEFAKANPDELLKLSPRQWEEIVAASYDRAGYDEVVLTPRSGDHGRDVIATKRGWGSVRIVDQVKAYAPGHRVSADEVRSLLGVLALDRNATKGVLTTTSTFAPRINEDPNIAACIPYRLELVDGKGLFDRLQNLPRA